MRSRLGETGVQSVVLLDDVSAHFHFQDVFFWFYSKDVGKFLYVRFLEGWEQVDIVSYIDRSGYIVKSGLFDKMDVLLNFPL